MEDGVLSSRARLYADGRLTGERGGTECHERTLDATGPAHVQAALDRAPEPLCPRGHRQASSAARTFASRLGMVNGLGSQVVPGARRPCRVSTASS
jgi:hypothetical protein